MSRDASIPGIILRVNRWFDRLIDYQNTNNKLVGLAGLGPELLMDSYCDSCISHCPWTKFQPSISIPIRWKRKDVSHSGLVCIEMIGFESCDLSSPLMFKPFPPIRIP